VAALGWRIDASLLGRGQGAIELLALGDYRIVEDADRVLQAGLVERLGPNLAGAYHE
jgi:hypothetical protein